MKPRYRPPLGWGDIFGALFNPPGDESELEEAFPRKFGLKHAVWFPYGRVAIQAYLENLEDRGREIVVSPFNCTALGNAIVSAGCLPYYIDTEPEGFNEDSDAFLEALKRPDCRAGISVSLWGIAPNEASWRKSPRPILHDFALRSLDSSPLPELRPQDAVMYSLGWGKPINGLRGSILGGENAEIAQKWRKWRSEKLAPGRWWRDFSRALMVKLSLSQPAFSLALRLSDLSMARRLRGSGKENEVWYPGDWNHRLCRNFIKLGLREIDAREKRRGERVLQVRTYLELLGDLEGEAFRLPYSAQEGLSHFPVRVADPTRLHLHLQRRGIFTSRELFDRLLCDRPHLRGNGIRSFPHARRLTQITLHLPLYPGMPLVEQQQVVEAINQFYQGDFER